MEISKSDWKLFRARIAEWQEDYMERLVKEYIDMLKGTGNASDKFLFHMMKSIHLKKL